MEKFTCVVDACSYINLQIPVITVRNQDLSIFEILCEETDVKVSDIVNNEIKRNKHKHKNLNALYLDNKKYKFGRKPNLAHFDKVLFNGNIFTNSNNQGEKVNLSVALNLFLQGSRKVVYLSDDESANDKFFLDIKENVKFCQFWNSFDAIFFLYMNGYKKKFSYNHAEQAFSDIISAFIRIDAKGFDAQFRNGEITERKKEDLINKKTQYYYNLKVKLIKRLNYIRNILNY